MTRNDRASAGRATPLEVPGTFLNDLGTLLAEMAL